jgi:hypothetical protein
LNLDNGSSVLGDSDDPVADVKVFLGGCGRVREYSLYHNALSGHA